METLLKIDGLWKYTKVIIPYLTDDQKKFVINEKKDKVVGIITTHISREIHFHTSEIHFPHVFWTKMKSLFDKFNRIQVM